MDQMVDEGSRKCGRMKGAKSRMVVDDMAVP